MTGFQITDWDAAYTNGAYIPDGHQWPDAWVAPAAQYRRDAIDNNSLQENIAYGDHERNRYDLFQPQTEPAGLFVFVHGGYWMKLDKSYWSHLAKGAIDAGWAVVIPSYRLCPDVDIGQIIQMIADAITHAARKVKGPIVLTGHSAGGHLVSAMHNRVCSIPTEIQSRFAHTVSISGVHDLRPLLGTTMNDALKLDDSSAIEHSPALMLPVEPCRITTWVGGNERAEFLRQSQLLSNIWRGLGAWTQCIVEPDQHHFSVIDGLANVNSPLMKTALSY